MSPNDHAAAASGRPRRVLIAMALAVAGSVPALLSPLVATAAVSPFLHQLNRVEVHLRTAIEIRPAQLGEYMGSSETVCGLGEDAAAAGDDAAAAADWSTLAQLVRDRDRPEAAAVDAAFARAEASLRTLRRRFSRGWRGQSERVRELRRGVGQALRGTRRLRRATAAMATSFASWEERDCAGARARIRAGTKGIPAALVQVNQGVWRLWLLSAGAGA